MNMYETKTIYNINDLTKKQILEMIEKYNEGMTFKEYKQKADAVFQAIQEGAICNSLELVEVCKRKALNNMIIKP